MTGKQVNAQPSKVKNLLSRARIERLDILALVRKRNS